MDDWSLAVQAPQQKITYQRTIPFELKATQTIKKLRMAS
jgi:hypothetical protein